MLADLILWVKSLHVHACYSFAHLYAFMNLHGLL